MCRRTVYKLHKRALAKLHGKDRTQQLLTEVLTGAVAKQRRPPKQKGT
jgi:hypothetical protein